MLHKGRYYMRITESLINKNQNYINYWTAESSYRDLAKFVSSYTAKKQDSSGVTYWLTVLTAKMKSSRSRML